MGNYYVYDPFTGQSRRLSGGTEIAPDILQVSSGGSSALDGTGAADRVALWGDADSLTYSDDLIFVAGPRLVLGGETVFTGRMEINMKSLATANGYGLVIAGDTAGSATDQTGIGVSVRATVDSNKWYGILSFLELDTNVDMDTVYGLFIYDVFKNTGATLQNNYGVFVRDLTAGVENYAWWSGLGESVFGDQVGIGGEPDASAMLDVQSTSRGFAPPRMTTTERNAISSPIEGLMVYNTLTDVYNYFDGSSWRDVSGGSGGGGSGSSLDWFNVTDYGAVGDGSTDDTSAVNSAITALNLAGGGVLYFPEGRYKTSGNLTLSQPTTVLGDGSINADLSVRLSRVDCSSGSAPLFLVTTKLCRFENIALVYSGGSTPTAGCAVRVTDTTAHQRVEYQNVFFYGFYDNVDSQSGSRWTMHDCQIQAPVRYGVRIRNTVNPDSGDWTISNCYFSASLYNSDAAIRIETSGGGRILNCKVNTFSDAKKFNHGIELADSDGTTSILLIDNCSIENYTGDGFHAVGVGYAQVIVHGTQFGQLDNSSGRAIYIDNVDNVVIDACLFHNDPGDAPYAVVLQNLDNVYLGAVINDGFGALLSTSSVTNLVDASGGNTSSTPLENYVINGGFRFFQRQSPTTATSRSDDTYGPDRWNILAQSAAVDVERVAVGISGTPNRYACKITQPNATAQRFGIEQIFKCNDSVHFRGETVTLQARIKCSIDNKTIRCAILEWTGTGDVVTSDVINDWTNTTYTAGNFFIGSNLTVAGVTNVVLSADTWADITLTAGISSSCANLIVIFWTQGTFPQTDTFHITEAGLYLSGEAMANWQPRPESQELHLCQAHYTKSFEVDTAPAQNNGIRLGAVHYQCHVAGIVTDSVYVVLPTQMFAAPTVTFYNHAAANTNWRNVTGGADSGTPVNGASSGRNALLIANPQAIGDVAGDGLEVHFTAEAEL